MFLLLVTVWQNLLSLKVKRITGICAKTVRYVDLRILDKHHRLKMAIFEVICKNYLLQNSPGELAKIMFVFSALLCSSFVAVINNL